MHPIERLLSKAGSRLLTARLFRLVSAAALAVFSWWFLYALAILAIKSMSLTYGGLFVVPALVLLALMVAIPLQWYQLSSPRKVARFLEGLYPQLQLSLRSALDFLEGRAHGDSTISNVYLEQVTENLRALDVREQPRFYYGRYALLTLLLNAGLWGVFQDRLSAKFYNPTLSIGQTHLDLNAGSITIFEPEYTQVPGRTLPMKPGNFSAYPGAKIRFLVGLPEGTKALYLSLNKDEQAIPLRINEERNAAYELLLMEDTELRFLVAESGDGGRTSPFRFEVKTDEPPEVLLRSYTPEGPINEMDPLIVELEVKDDFGTKDLEAVVSWEGGERRVPINIPGGRRNHFISKNQWFLSDFEMGEVESFTIYFEARDNNPINGPGIGKSATLTYELESPDKKYDEFMQLAKELLNSMTFVLADNLDTELGNQVDMDVLSEAEAMGKRIGDGLYSSQSMTNSLIRMVRETPNLTRLDQNFLHQFRNGVTRQARARSEMGLMFSHIQYSRARADLQKLNTKHRSEELKVEGLTYELLLQLKMWAIFELERQNNELQNEMEQLEDLLANSENMDQDELMEMFDKLWEEIMKDFQKMMANAAKEMDMNMQEFMNSEAMQDTTDQMQELREKIMEALREGDMEKAKALMQEMKAQMEAAYQSMQESIGEMSPEMQAMMQNMRELQGLLRELKNNEESLERQTRELKKKLDEMMGGNEMKLGEQQRQEHRKATERIHEMLTELYNKLVSYKSQDLSQEIIEQIGEINRRLENEQLPPRDRDSLAEDARELERVLDDLARDGLARLQDITLKNLEQTEKLQEYLDQGELTLGLESGMKLDSSLVNGERVSDRMASRKIREEAQPKETFRKARQELYQILNALQQMKQNMEDRRREFMEQQGEEGQQRLAQQQQQLQQMIQEFMERTGESFGGSQIEEKLRDIGRSMNSAEGKLEGSRLEGGIRYEQEALQKIGEMMEQLQQSSRPNSRPGAMRFQRQTGDRGDPSLEDIYIPDSEKRATRDQMKDAIRQRLQKNLPDSYGKEIRKYYEKLMDQ